MGLPAQAITPDGTIPHFASPLFALPSPASDAGSLYSPTLKSILSRSKSYLSQLSPRDGLLQSHCAMPTEPDGVRQETVMTPPAEEMLEPNMNMIVGGALAPMPSTPPLPTLPKAETRLRLPSFEALGIAAPRPGRPINNAINNTSTAVAGGYMQLPLSCPPAEVETFAPFESSNTKPGMRGTRSDSALVNDKECSLQTPFRRYVETLTPPAEAECLDWESRPIVRTAAMESPYTDPHNPTTPGNVIPPVGESSATGLAPGISVTQSISDEDADLWIGGAMSALRDNIRSGPILRSSVMILSHALPCPSPSGHIYSKIINEIQGTTPVSPGSPMTWINVFHAIPGRFNLADLPSSPPISPGPAIGGDDYFTHKVFDSAVSILDYQEDMSRLPRSPMPVVPPSSIDISIVERYIPPTTTYEFARMFEPDGPSILVDRLVELSPNNGSLLFIYPTKVGAQTFMRQYLGPVLDPLLRTMVVVHGLSSDLSREIGSMPAADSLPDFERLHDQITKLCTTLNKHDSAAHRFNPRRPIFSLSYGSKQYVKVHRDAWAKDWWAKQDKPRIRETIAKYARDAQKKSSNEYLERAATPTELLQQLLEGIARKQYPPGQEPDLGIEVGVFVIKRSE